MAAAVQSCVAKMPISCLSGIFLESAEQGREEGQGDRVPISPGIRPQPSEASLESAVLPALMSPVPTHPKEHLEAQRPEQGHVAAQMSLQVVTIST